MKRFFRRIWCTLAHHEPKQYLASMDNFARNFGVCTAGDTFFCKQCRALYKI